MKEWEYLTLKTKPEGAFKIKVDQDEIDENFNELGLAGWEMVNSFSVDQSGTTRFIFSVFKRLRQNA